MVYFHGFVMARQQSGKASSFIVKMREYRIDQRFYHL